MILLLNKNETIVKIDENVTVEGNLFRLADGDGIVKSNLTKVEVAEIPENVVAHKYNYNLADGFYENPDYIEQVDRKEIDELKMTIADLTEQVLLGGL